MSVVMKVLERVVQFLPDKEPDPLIAKGGYIGSPLSRADGPLKIRGEATFAAEYKLENLSYAVLVCSTIARGKAVRIDASEAERAPGCIAVMTHKNAPKMNPPPLIDLTDAKKGFAASDHPIMENGEVDWDGQPMAVVVAETLDQAQFAASLVRIKYEEKAPSVSFDDLKADAVVPHDIMGEPAEVKLGKVADGIAEADFLVDNVYRTPRYNHNAIEPHAAVAVWDENGRLSIFDSTQSVSENKQALAKVFDIGPEKVQVIGPFVGGGFGGKAGVWSYIPLCAGAAKLVKRPVQLSLSRENVFQVIGGRTLAEQRVLLGAKQDGKLTAILHTAITATTAHGRYAEQCTFPVRHLYASKNMFIGQKIVYLNAVANTWMRAPGESIGTFALESAMDELSYRLEIDPIELRRINEPAKDPTKDTEFSLRNLTEAYRRGAEKFGWARRNPKPQMQREGKWLVGQGVATAYYPAFRFPSKARVRLCADGSAVIQAGANEMGMGMATTQIQHAADRLGLPIEKVAFQYGHSDLPYSPMAGGSNQTVSIAAAVQAAVEKAHRELLKLVGKGSPLDGAKYEELEARDGGLFRVGASRTGETIASILGKAGKDQIEAEAASSQPMEMLKYSMASYGAQFCEVRVNEESGEVRVSRWLGSFDCGTIINPKTAASQFRGGIIMGIGMALTEETLFDERKGRIMNPSLAEYHVPVNLDVPHIEIIYNNIPDQHTPLGAHGIGEIGITGAAAAIANAVYHATGKRVRDLPITLDKLM